MTIERHEIDARGQKCPLPVLRLEKRISTLPRGATLTVLATDELARIDIALFCRQNGHQCRIEDAPGLLRFEITKGDGATG